MEGDFVGMANCFFCNQPKHILIDRRLRKSLPKNAVYDKHPCDECKSFMEQGIIFIGVRDGEQGENPYRTGEWFVIKEEAVKNMPLNDELKQSIIKSRVCFIDQQTLVKFGMEKFIQEEKKIAK